MKKTALERRLKERRSSITEMELFIKNQGKLNEKIELALFGNSSENGVVNDVKEMRAVFNSVDGFGSVSVMILKALILISAAIGAVYVVLGFFKKIGK